jgi:type IV pilus assembly protein PilQ
MKEKIKGRQKLLLALTFSLSSVFWGFTSPPIKIWDIKFELNDDSSQVKVYGTGPINYQILTQNTRYCIMKIKNAYILRRLERHLDVSSFESPINMITSYKMPGKSNEVVLKVKLNQPVQHRVLRGRNSIIWEFKIREEKIEAKNKRKQGRSFSKTIAKESDEPYIFHQEKVLGFSKSIPMQLRVKISKKRKYRGRPIDLDFHEADIHNILRLLAEVGGVNIVTSDDVKGTVTIRMRNVPWDQALDVILQSKKLGKEWVGNIIRVAPQAQLDKERELAIARWKAKQQLKPLETRLIPVSYATAEKLLPRAQELLSPRGRVSIDERTNMILARDVKENLDQIEELVRYLDTQTPQVLIEARIVEVSTRYERGLGIQWGGNYTRSPATGNPTGLAFPGIMSIAGGATDENTPMAGLTPVAEATPNPNFAINLPAAVGTGKGGALGITLGTLDASANLNLRLSAMEDTGRLRVISAPKILTLDNHEAHIEQGTLIPYSQVSAQGVQTAFQEAKLHLKVRPHVAADGSIMMKVKITRDEPDFSQTGARGDPTILKREAETSLMVPDGHTAVIGGILTRNVGTNYSQVPWFADIPIIGWFFKSRRDSDRRNELLIFLTPRVVNRAESIGR